MNCSLRVTWCLITGCLFMLVSRSIQSIGSYVNAIKATYKYTQTETENIMSMVHFAYTMAFPTGFLISKFGTRIMSCVSSWLVMTGFLLLWSTSFNKEFYHNNSWLQCVYFYVAGSGTTAMYICALTANINNFSSKHQGKVVSTLQFCNLFGQTAFAFFYGVFFINGHHKDEENQDLKGYYLMTAICAGVIGMLGPTLQKVNRLEKEEEVENIIIEPADQISCYNSFKENSSESQEIELTMKKLMIEPSFHFLFWLNFLCYGSFTAYMNNIAIYLKSFDMEHLSTAYTSIFPVISILASCAVGILSDTLFKRHHQRIVILLSVNIIQATMMFICVFLSDRLPVFILGFIAVASLVGANECLIPLIVNEKYGSKYLDRIIGAVFAFEGVSVILTQFIYGWIYEKSIASVGERDCYGAKCFTWSFALLAVTCAGSAIFTFLLYMVEIRAFKSNKMNHD